MNQQDRDAVNPLLDAASDVFAMVAPLRTRPDRAGPFDAFRASVVEALHGLDRCGLENRLALADVESARFAVVAYVDEAVIASEWDGRAEWMAHPLQLELFGEQTAGQKFFDRLGELRREPERNIALIEVYCACLHLGFEGAYAFQEPERLMVLQMDLHAQIEDVRGQPDPRLSPERLTFTQKVGRAGARMPYWAIAVTTVAAVGLSHLYYLGATASEVEAAAQDIRETHIELFGRGEDG